MTSSTQDDNKSKEKNNEDADKELDIVQGME